MRYKTKKASINGYWLRLFTWVQILFERICECDIKSWTLSYIASPNLLLHLFGTVKLGVTPSQKNKSYQPTEKCCENIIYIYKRWNYKLFKKWFYKKTMGSIFFANL